MHRPVLLTLVLLAALGAIFLKGFREAVGLAVPIVGVYLAAERRAGRRRACIISGRIPASFSALDDADAVGEYGSPFKMVVVALLLFPKLALGLSGFETGVAVMPLVQGDARRHARHIRRGGSGTPRSC